VGTGSRQKTRQIKNPEPRSDFIGTEKALAGTLTGGRLGRAFTMMAKSAR
jgi:hypothetical protein